MKLSDQAVDQLLHAIETFDRERGIPHDYSDLETVLRNTDFAAAEGDGLNIVVPHPAAPETATKIAETNQEFLAHARTWRDPSPA